MITQTRKGRWMNSRLETSAHVAGLTLDRGEDHSAILEETRVGHTGTDAGVFVTWRQMFVDVDFHVQ